MFFFFWRTGLIDDFLGNAVCIGRIEEKGGDRESGFSFYRLGFD